MRNPLTTNNVSHVSHRFRLSPTRVRAHTRNAVIRHQWDRWDSRDSDAFKSKIDRGAFPLGPSPCRPAAGVADRGKSLCAMKFE